MPFFDKYPYTNFHNVNLDWVLERVKEWGELVEQNNTAFHDLKEANENFKNYVTNYLENLDVQVAIDDKLDRMFESGVLGEYLQPYVSPVVTTWLDENITEPTGVIIDSSLTVAGACADAKAVGDITTYLENAVLSTEAKNAILDSFLHTAWINTDGLIYYNRLANALNIAGWNYQWNAESGVLPQFMTASSYNFTTEAGALYIMHPVLDFNYNGNCILEITMKSPSISDSNPQILIRNEVISEGVYRGIKVIMAFGNNTGVDYGVCGISVNGVNTTITPYVSTNEYHTYKLTAVNNVYSVSIDGVNIDITQNDNTSPYYGRTGITTTAEYIAYIKDIKFKRL